MWKLESWIINKPLRLSLIIQISLLVLEKLLALILRGIKISLQIRIKIRELEKVIVL